MFTILFVGPFFIKQNENYYLVGITSWGYDCGGAGAYTKVSNFVDWIMSTTKGI
jgi:secreted trypsin-like serine protease